MSEIVVLIYDDNCSLCRGCMRWIKMRAINANGFEFISCRSEDRKTRFPQIDEAACLESFHLILPNGKVFAGEEAIPEIAQRLNYFAWFAALFNAPITKYLARRLYRLVSNNRYIISRTILPLKDEAL